MGIPVLPPDVNHSEDQFTVDGDAIRFGLGAVKNVGHGLVRAMCAKREEGGPFKSLEDFIQRMGDEINKRAVENFIKCGAMDCFGHNRSELLAVYDQMMDSIASSRKKNLEGQMGLFSMLAEEDAGASIPIPKKPELDRSELLSMEKETTGIYISGHPMDAYRALLRNTHVVNIGDLMGEESNYRDDQIVSVAGIVQSVKMKTTRNNSMMAYVTVEDDTASIEMLAFSNVLGQYGGYLRENSPVVITGRLSIRDEKEPQIVVNRARPMSDFADQDPAPEPEMPKENRIHQGTLYLRLPAEDQKLYPKIKAILNMFPGNSGVVLFFEDTRQRRGTRCVIMDSMLNELKNVLGEANVVLK
jgi:DNA polymerase-3 subunit alpha